MFDLFNQPAPSGAQLRDIGMQTAADHASEAWNEKAYEYLKKYLKINRDKFMTEFFRQWAESNGLHPPPTARAYGSIISKAAKKELIKHCGYSRTSNYKAHKTPASVWQAL